MSWWKAFGFAQMKWLCPHGKPHTGVNGRNLLKSCFQNVHDVYKYCLNMHVFTNYNKCYK